MDEDQRESRRKSKMAKAAGIRQRSLERQAAEPPLTEAKKESREKRREEARKDRAALKAKRMEDALPGETYEKMRKRQNIKRHDAFRDARDKRREEMISSGRIKRNPTPLSEFHKFTNKSAGGKVYASSTRTANYTAG